MELKTWDELELSTVRWAEARKIIPNSTPLAQSRKTLEEAGELIEAAAKLKVLNALAAGQPRYWNCTIWQAERGTALAELKDAAGDVMVTLVNSCALADVSLRECFNLAYNQIKDRKGTLLPNGIFQKETA